MVVMDQYMRKIIGFAVQPGDPDGIASCCMINKIIAGKLLPSCLSSDIDPLFPLEIEYANHRGRRNQKRFEMPELLICYDIRFNLRHISLNFLRANAFFN